MDFSSLFNYPDTEKNSVSEKLVFLENIDSEDWAKILVNTETFIFKKGETVIHIGDANRILYIVKSGSLEIFVPGKNNSSVKRISLIETGSVFGEISFFDGQPRSASVRALTDGEMLGLSLEGFEILAAREPELSRKIIFDLARILSIRLRETTNLLLDFSK